MNNQYKIEEYSDVEHCVYHALTDDPEDLTNHRIAHFVSRLTAELIEKEILSTDQIEEFLRSCRG